MGSIEVSLCGIDLSQLIGREKDSFTIPIKIAKNIHSISAKALADTGANGLAFMNTDFAILLSKFLKVRTHRLSDSCEVRGYDGKQASPITHVVIFTLIVDGRRQLDVPFLIVDLGKHDVILGRLWFAKYRVLPDCTNRQLRWPDEVSLKDQIVTKNYVPVPRQILQRAKEVNPAHQQDAERRDRAIERQESQIPVEYSRTYRKSYEASLIRMSKAIGNSKKDIPEEELIVTPI